jgi:hypothetical protein
MDLDTFVPIKIETRRMIRGAEREFETSLGDYKEVNGWYLPFSIESNPKGSSNRQKVSYDKIEANIELSDARFRRPAVAAAQPDRQPDASTTSPRKPESEKPAPKPPQSEKKNEGAGR